MSKSKGNVMDPLELVDEYGADALRFTLTAMSGQARDIRLAKPRIEGYRNFGTKLWNAARFCQMNGCVGVEGFDPAAVTLTVNRWVRGETLKAVRDVTSAIEACAFDTVADTLYRFIWNLFCDWYVEFAKPILNGEDAAAKAGASTPMGAQAEALYALFDKLGYGGKDFSAIIRMLSGRLETLA